MMRLDRFLSKTLYITRKEARLLLRQKRITLNGSITTKLGAIMDEHQDKVYFDGKELIYEEYSYYLINKPAGYVCAAKDAINPTIIEYNPLFMQKKLHTVGRLDKNTTGVLILTNNGEMTHKLISPKSKIFKTYFVNTSEMIPANLINIFAEGFNIDNEFKTMPAKLEILTETTARLSIYEGKYHQVKRMFKTFGINVVKLHREQFGSLRVDDLEIGEFRKLTISDLEKLIKD
ncbi:MAG TPA: pseudouridine synthase [Bacilli bacterium]|nr:pseudouridine synthase [Bacilli bacterium]